jgi:hypothetical protein
MTIIMRGKEVRNGIVSMALVPQLPPPVIFTEVEWNGSPEYDYIGEALQQFEVQWEEYHTSRSQ